jgi:hypothetical protein
MGTTYRWFVQQYQGKYYLRESFSGFYAGIGRFSMATLEEFLNFKSQTRVWTFGVGPA